MHIQAAWRPPVSLFAAQTADHVTAQKYVACTAAKMFEPHIGVENER